MGPQQTALVCLEAHQAYYKEVKNIIVSTGRVAHNLKKVLAQFWIQGSLPAPEGNLETGYFPSHSMFQTKHEFRLSELEVMLWFKNNVSMLPLPFPFLSLAKLW